MSYWNERWSWVQFVCAFLLAGFIAFLNVSVPFDELAPHLAKVLVIASVCGVIAGRFGDAAWAGLARLFRWI